MGDKTIRKAKLCKKNDNKYAFAALDHGITMGVFGHLENMKELILQLDEADVDGIIVHRGILKQMLNEGVTLKNSEWILHLSASTNISSNTNYKKLICSVEEAVQLGATAVSIHINLGTDNDACMLEDFGIVSRECDKWGMPLLCMMYDKSSENNGKHLVRIAEEVGADFIKVKYIKDEFDNLKSNIPVIFAGGEKEEDQNNYLQNLTKIINKSGNGICVGRNVIDSNDPLELARKICNIVHNKSEDIYYEN